jgi:DNA-binding MarR family transcriptional regulator
METQDIRTLRILEKVGDDFAPSQREMAKQLNISLGLVNSFIKRLALKGYVKASSIPRQRLRYILTPKGMTEKSRLTYRYIQFSYQYYREARQRLQKLFSQLETSGVRRVVFYGATDLAEIAFLSLKETAIELVAVVDDRNSGKKILGREVIDSRGLGQLSFDRIVVTDDTQRESILNSLLSSYLSRREIVFID